MHVVIYACWYIYVHMKKQVDRRVGGLKSVPGQYQNGVLKTIQ